MADNSDQEEMIAQFADITGLSTDRSKFHLESANWTLQLALANFYEQDDGNPMEEDVINLQSDEDNSMDVASSSFFPAGAAAEAVKMQNVDKKKKPKVKSSSGPRIATIHNTKSDDEDDDEEEGQAFYAGGSERSGQQILGPPRKNKDFVSEIFRCAQESGAQPVERTTQTSSSRSGPSTFVGTGYRLGQTNDDHVTLPEQLSRPSRPNNIDVVVLRLWRQGFTINDGEFRSYDEQSNRDFLESIKKGEIPMELRLQGSTVHVDLEDHRNEDYKQVKKIKPFAGKGHTLGSPAPTVVTSPVSTPTQAPASVAAAEQSANEQLNVNADQPTTMIQVRLVDGSRVSTRFNHSHTINDIRNYITTVRPQYAAQSFALLTTFPSKELTDGTETIEKAGLLNAAIMQRLK